MPLHSIDLNSQYRLYAFASYRDMAAAKGQTWRVVPGLNSRQHGFLKSP